MLNTQSAANVKEEDMAVAQIQDGELKAQDDGS